MVAFERGIKFSDGLKTLVQHNYPIAETSGSPNPKNLPTHPMAFVLGTRGTDPNAG
jgi:hypothetical protein